MVSQERGPGRFSLGHRDAAQAGAGAVRGLPGTHARPRRNCYHGHCCRNDHDRSRLRYQLREAWVREATRAGRGTLHLPIEGCRSGSSPHQHCSLPDQRGRLRGALPHRVRYGTRHHHGPPPRPGPVSSPKSAARLSRGRVKPSPG